MITYYGSLTNLLNPEYPTFNIGARGLVFSSLNPIPATAGGGGHVWTLVPPAGAAAPAGANAAVTTPENVPYAFTAADFQFSDPNDSPPNNFQAVKITTLPAVGVLKDNGTDVTLNQYVSVSDIDSNLLKFYPNNGETGTPYDDFDFEVQDDGGTDNGGVDTDPDPKTMTINVTSPSYVNQAPSGADGSVTVTANQNYTIQATDFGFSDPNSPANNFKAVEVTTLPSVGTLTKNGVAVTAEQFVNVNAISLGLLVYAPAANASGNSYASFTFQVQNDGGTANSGVDTDPTPRTLGIQVAQAPAYSLLDNSTLDVAGADAIGLFANTSNFNPSTLAIASVNGSSGNVGTAITTTEGGTLTVNADGGFDYTPASNFTGSDSFTKRVARVLLPSVEYSSLA